MAPQTTLHTEMRNKMVNITNMLSVYFIAGTQDCKNKDLILTLKQALEAGITCFQLREKGEESLASNEEELKDLAIECKKLCKEYGVPFIINDYVHLAVEVDADGVHVGQDDLAIHETINFVGKDKIIGLSTNTSEEIQEAQALKEIDYLGLGPVFSTGSKTDHNPPLEIDGLAHIIQQNKSGPIVAIGGITEDNAKDILGTNVDGLAVISAISKSDNMTRTIRKLKGK